MAHFYVKGCSWFGYGANGNDLISIGSSWQTELPDTMFISPNAPFDCTWGSNAYQWFELSSISPESIGSGLDKAGPYLNGFIDHISKETKVPQEKIFFVSFSQGTMMALYHLCQRNSKCAGIMGYSGLLLCDDDFNLNIKRRLVFYYKTLSHSFPPPQLKSNHNQ